MLRSESETVSVRGSADAADPVTSRTGYVVKVYPRFSETFIVTEVLAREAAGEHLSIFALRPTSDARFQPEIASVQAPVAHLAKPTKLSDSWAAVAAAQSALPDFGRRFGEILPELAAFEPTDVVQGIELAQAAAQAGIEHLHAHFASNQSRVAWVAAKLLRIGYSLTTHAKDLFHDDVDRALLGLVLRDADFVVAISDFNRDFIVREYPDVAERVVVVRNGIDLARFTYTDPSEPIDVLKIAGVGRLIEKKGFDVLIDAVERLAGTGMRCEVRIAGDGELRAQLQAHIDEAGLSETISLLGPRSQSEVVDLLRWADLMVVPSVLGQDGNVEGLPTVLLEAMALGVPCIGTDVTGIPEALRGPEQGRTGVVVPAGDAGALGAAIRDVAAPEFPRRDMARRARDLIEREFNTRIQSRRLSALQAERSSTATTRRYPR